MSLQTRYHVVHEGDTASPHTEPSPARCVAWVLALRGLDLYQNLTVARELAAREAWLDTLAGRVMSVSERMAYETFLRRAAYRLLSGQRYTVIDGRRVITASIFQKTQTLGAKALPVRRPRPVARGIRLARLLLESARHVQVCPECRGWFARKTTRQKFCGTRCANNAHSRQLRERRGKHPIRHTKIPAGLGASMAKGKKLRWSASSARG
jgi:hypothetical protein